MQGQQHAPDHLVDADAQSTLDLQQPRNPRLVILRTKVAIADTAPARAMAMGNSILATITLTKTLRDQ